MQDLDFRLLRDFTCRFDAPWAYDVSQVANDKTFGICAYAVLFLVVLLSRRGRERAARTVVAVLLAVGVVHGIREVVWRVAPRDRPGIALGKERLLITPPERATCEARPDHLVSRAYPPTSPSFPSSHTITAAAVAAVLTYAWLPVGLLAWAYALFVGLGRLYWSKHWPSDIAGSLLLAAVVGWLAWRVAERIVSRARPRPPEFSVPDATPGI